MLRRLPILLIFLAAALGAFFLRDHLSFAALSRHREALLAFRDAHPLAAPLAFVATYAALVALSLPGALVATLTGGFLFGLFPGTLYNITAATVGAVIVFLAARAGFGADLARRAEEKGGKPARLMQGLRENEWSFLFLMRLVPAVPFFLANLAAAAAGARLDRFVISTFLGIIPGALVYTSVGAGLSGVFARGESPDLGVIFSPPVLLPLLGLAALSALPILLKTLRQRGPA